MGGIFGITVDDATDIGHIDKKHAGTVDFKKSSSTYTDPCKRSWISKTGYNYKTHGSKNTKEIRDQTI